MTLVTVVIRVQQHTAGSWCKVFWALTCLNRLCKRGCHLLLAVYLSSCIHISKLRTSKATISFLWQKILHRIPKLFIMTETVFKVDKSSDCDWPCILIMYEKVFLLVTPCFQERCSGPGTAGHENIKVRLTYPPAHCAECSWAHSVPHCQVHKNRALQNKYKHFCLLMCLDDTSYNTVHLRHTEAFRVTKSDKGVPVKLLFTTTSKEPLN